MKTIRYDPPVNVSGRAIVVISIVTASGYKDRGACVFVGEKRPIAVVCRCVDGESIFSVDGRRLDTSALQKLISQTSDCDGASATQDAFVAGYIAPDATSSKTAVCVPGKIRFQTA